MRSLYLGVVARETCKVGEQNHFSDARTVLKRGLNISLAIL